MENHVKIFSGSEVEVIRVRVLLEQFGIEFIERNDIQSGITAGFGTIDKAVHLFVESHNANRALKLIDNMSRDEMAD